MNLRTHNACADIWFRVCEVLIVGSEAVLSISHPRTNQDGNSWSGASTYVYCSDTKEASVPDEETVCSIESRESKHLGVHSDLAR